MVRNNLIKWSIILTIVAGFDLLTTYLGISLGGVEANPLFKNASIETMILAKIAGIGFLIWISLHLKQKICLILVSGINVVAIVSNIRTICLMC